MFPLVAARRQQERGPGSELTGAGPRSSSAPVLQGRARAPARGALRSLPPVASSEPVLVLERRLVQAWPRPVLVQLQAEPPRARASWFSAPEQVSAATVGSPVRCWFARRRYE